MIAKKYLNSRLGRTIEKMKVAYLAGKHIIFLATTEPEFVNDILSSESILPLKKDKQSSGFQQGDSKNIDFIQSSDGTGHLDSWMSFTEPHIYVYQLGDYSPEDNKKSSFTNAFPDSLLKKYVDLCSGLSTLDTSLNEQQKKRLEILRNSLIIIVCNSEFVIPAYIDPYSEVVTVPFVSKDEFAEIVSKEVHNLDGEELHLNSDGYYTIQDEAYINRLYHSMRGLNVAQIVASLRTNKNVLGQIYYSSKDGDKSGMDTLLENIRRNSERIIASSAALTIVESIDKRPEGMGRLVQWISEHKEEIASPQKNDQYVINAPKGILVSGVPGTGKSMMAKYIANELGLSLIRMDIGDVMGGLVGDSEKNMNKALHIIEALSPCVLWIDEIEKAFAGSSGSNGHEVTKRVYGKFLTWMQEKGNRGVSCFVFATANDISSLPPETFRSGRFDEKFYMFMPSADECAAIFGHHIVRQCDIHQARNKDNSLSLPLFDRKVINAEFFKRVILEGKDTCLVDVDKLDDCNEPKVTNLNHFFVGSDIELLIAKAKTRYRKLVNEGRQEHTINKKAIFDSDLFEQCLKDVLKEMRTYGETNLLDIARSFSQLSNNNFVPASDDIVVPLYGYNELRYKQKKGKLYDLGNEGRKWQLEISKSVYNEQLYNIVRNTVNNMADDLINHTQWKYKELRY